MDWLMTAAILVTGIGGGLLGALVGLGGGILVVPILTLLLGVPIHHAIGASIVAVAATSSTAASTYLDRHLTNVRLGMTMETATTIGGILGGLTATLLNREVLSGIFALALVGMGISMFYKVKDEGTAMALSPQASGFMAKLAAAYQDPYTHQRVDYQVRRLPLGLGLSFIAGNLSGLLGIGGGAIKVPAMVLLMGVPMRVASATSNFMIGVTAVASAYIYYTRGFVDPLVAGPVAVGIFLGASLTPRLAGKIDSKAITKIMAVILLVMAVEMALSAFGIRIH